MVSSKLDVINLACLRLGQKMISSLDESTFTSQASFLYDKILGAAITSSQFTFAIKWNALSLLVEPPSFSFWQYAYALPPDWKATVDVNPRVPFDIVENRVLYANISNSNNPFMMKYLFDVEAQYLPDHFVMYLSTAIAADLALSSTVSAEMHQALFREAANYYSISIATDAQNRPNQSFSNSRWLNPRKYYPNLYPVYNFYPGA